MLKLCFEINFKKITWPLSNAENSYYVGQQRVTAEALPRDFLIYW